MTSRKRLVFSYCCLALLLALSLIHISEPTRRS